MVHIVRSKSWALKETDATPEEVFLNRRTLVKAMGLGAIGVASATMLSGRQARAADEATADLYPAPRNDGYTISRPVTPEDINSRYNNFYEFGSQKQIWRAAQALKTNPWEMTIDGLVEKPITIEFDDLVRKMSLEERLYRHRCVEAWSMTIPWTGFPLADLVAMAKPLSSAKYVHFETFMDPAVAGGQRQSWYPWPYVEGVTMEEAANDLAFLVTGAYGKPAANQFGAPIRLALPWKYGFKSIKSIKRIRFTDERPVSFWEAILPAEYGFWANVNPQVPHRRWSQAEEQVLGTDDVIPTRIYNGYGEQVAGLYKDLQDQPLFM